MTTQNMRLGVDIVADAAQANREADKLHRKIKGIQQDASNVNIGGARPASQTAAARAARPTGGVVDPDVGLNRGTAGGNVRGDARDFARQAQGLGGLVHVYATFAANLFAVSAAFNALKKAADVTNMVEGLNQLGAASGKNLGSMAKSLTIITEGAISMKEAMAATAQASAAGLSGDQLQRLTKVAKTASQALGRDMGDALNRLSRGVTKIEPELLDELGIMVKVDRAARDYALTLGKTATQLTEFEKRQSFAIAVIEQGEKKFGKINIESNPYQKLEASFTNLMVSGGELINKVLGPIAKFLGENPGALTAAVGAFAAMLINKAIPALGQWRKGVLEAAEVAEARAKRISANLAEFQAVKAGSTAASFDEQARQARERAFQIATENKLFSDKSKSMYQLAAAHGPVDIAQKQLQIKLTSINKLLQEDKAYLVATGGAVAADTEQRLANIAALEKQKTAILAVNAELLNAQRIQTLGDEVQNAAEVPSWEERQRMAAARKAERSAGARRISANVISNMEEGGMRHAWKQISVDIAEHNAKVGEAGGQINKFGSMWLKTSGAIKIGAQAFGLAFNALSGFLGALGIATVSFSIIEAIFSKNNKEVAELSSATEGLDEATKGLSRTFDYISKQDPLAQISPENIQARANAINELSNGVQKITKSLINADDTAGGFDRFIDGFKIMVGKDLKSETTRSVSTALSKGILLAADSPELDILKTKLKNILGTSDLSNEGLQAAFDKFDPSTFKTKLEEVSAAQNEYSKTVNNSASRISEYGLAATNTLKQFDTLSASFNPTDTLAKLGLDQMSQGLKLGEALKEPIQALSTLSSIIKDFDQLKLFPPEAAKQLLGMQKMVEDTAQAYGEASKNARFYREQLEKAGEKVKDAGGRFTGWNKRTSVDQYKATKEFDEIKGAADYFNEKEAEALKKSRQLMVESAGIAEKMYAAGAQKLKESFKYAQEQASIGISKAAVSQIAGPGSAEIQADLARQEIAIQTRLIDAQIAQVVETEKLRLTLEEANIRAEQLKVGAEGGPEMFKKLEALGKAFTSNQLKQQAMSGSLGNIGKNIDKADPETRLALMSTRAAVSGSLAQKETQRGKIQEINIGEAQRKEQEALQYKIQGLELEKQLAAIQASRISTLSGASEIYSQELHKAERQLQITQEQKDIEILETKIKSDAIQAGIASANVTKEELKALIANNSVLKGKASLQEYSNKLAAMENSTLAYNLSVADKLASEKNRQASIDVQKLDLQTQSIQLLAEQGGLTEVEKTSQLQVLESQKLQVQQSAEKYAIQLKIDALEKSKVDGKDNKEIQAQIDANNTKLTQLSQMQGLILANKSAQDQWNLSQAAHNDKMRELQSLTESLTAVFGDLGAAIGNFAQVFESATKKQIDGQKALEKAKKAELGDLKIEDDGDPKQIEKFQKEKTKIEEKYTKKSTILQLQANAEILGSAKKMFKEKTVAYKVLEGMERAMHAAKMAMQVEAMIMDAKSTMSTIANTVATIAKDGIAAVLNQGKGDPYTAFARMAAMAAFVASIAGGSSGSPKAPPGGITAADRQETQGTGMSWVNGKKVENGRGVFGDAEAKSESLTKIAEILEDNQIEGLYYDKNILDTLRSINKGIGGLAAKLVTAKGLRSGAITNVRQDKILDSGISISGQGTRIGKNSQIINAPLSMQDILDGNAQINQYENAKRPGSNNNLVMRNNTALSAALTTSLKDIFGGGLKLMQQLGGSVLGLKGSNGLELGGTDLSTYIEEQFMAADLTGALSQISLRGLTGSEMQEELQAVFGAELDNIASSIFGEAMNQYRKSGEGMLETVARVVDGNSKVSTALDYLGVTFQKVDTGLRGTTGLSFALSEALIDAAGGLDKFTEQAEFFAEHFLTEEQRMSRKQEALTRGLGDLVNKGLIGADKLPKTRAEFASLVQSALDAGEAGVPLYQALMNLAPAFDAVASSIEDARQKILDDVAAISQRTQEMAFGFEYDTKDNQGKYEMNDAKAGEMYAALQTALKADPATNAENWDKNSALINKLLDNINTNWGLLDADQKKAQLSEYQAKVKDIEGIAEKLGVSALVGVTPDGEATVGAIKDAQEAIVAAIKGADPTGLISGAETSANLANILPVSMAKGMLDAMSSMALWTEQKALISKFDQAFTALTDNDPKTVANLEAMKAVLEHSLKVSNDTQDESQKRAAEEIGKLANGTGDMNKVLQALADVINDFKSVAREPVKIDMNMNIKKEDVSVDVNGTGGR